VPSAAGTYPAVQSSTLRSEITFEVEINSQTVVGKFGIMPTRNSGTFLEYAYYLEVGTTKMEPRPWLTLTIDEIMDSVKSILGAT